MSRLFVIYLNNCNTKAPPKILPEVVSPVSSPNSTRGFALAKPKVSIYSSCSFWNSKFLVDSLVDQRVFRISV